MASQEALAYPQNAVCVVKKAILDISCICLQSRSIAEFSHIPVGDVVPRVDVGAPDDDIVVVELGCEQVNRNRSILENCHLIPCGG